MYIGDSTEKPLITSASFGTGVGVSVGVGVIVGVDVAVSVGVAVRVTVGVDVGVEVPVGAGVGVTIAVGVGVGLLTNRAPLVNNCCPTINTSHPQRRNNIPKITKRRPLPMLYAIIIYLSDGQRGRLSNLSKMTGRIPPLPF